MWSSRFARLRKRHGSSFGRFLFFGVLNSGSTYLLYLLFLTFLPYPVAYTVSYVAGIYISYYLNSRFVFEERLQLRKALQYPAVYLVQYLVALGLLYLLVDLAHLSKALAPLAALVVTVPLSYSLSRFLIKRQPTREPA